jgi:hypothetical protein
MAGRHRAPDVHRPRRRANVAVLATGVVILGGAAVASYVGPFGGTAPATGRQQ